MKGNPLPFAVGILLVDKRYIELYGMKGRGISIVHCYEDLLWEYGGKIYPNDGYQPNCVVAIEKVDDDDDEMGEEERSEEVKEEDEVVKDEIVKEEDEEVKDKEKEEEEMNDNIPPIPTTAMTNDSNIENECLTNILTKELEKDNSKENIDLFGSIDNDEEDDDEDIPMLFEDDLDEDNNEIDLIMSDENERKKKMCEMDEKLKKCLLQCFRNKVKDEDLPIHAGILYQSLMIPCRQKYIYYYYQNRGDIIDVKQSSYKKILPFLKEMKKLNLLEFKIRRGIPYVSSINRENEIYKEFEVWKNESGITIIKSCKSEDEIEKAKRMEILNKVDIRLMYKPKSNYYNEIFENAKGIDSLYSLKEIKESINNYLKEKNLIYESNKKYSKIPLYFFNCLGKDPLKYLKNKIEIKFDGYENENLLISRDKLYMIIVDKCNEYRVIKEYGSDRYIVKKGEIKNVEISEEKRMGRKYITTIKNLEDYGINLNLFVNEISKKCASSGTIRTESSCKSEVVQIQGRCSNEIKNLLLNEYKFPCKYVILK